MDWEHPTVTGFFSEADPKTSPLQTATLSGKNIVSRPNWLRARDGSSPGWHFSWILNGAVGLAHKYCVRVEGIPDWAKCDDKAAFVKYLETEILAKLQSHHSGHGLIPSNMAKEDVPQALILHPEKFPSILRDVQW